MSKYIYILYFTDNRKKLYLNFNNSYNAYLTLNNLL